MKYKKIYNRKKTILKQNSIVIVLNKMKIGIKKW